MREDGEEFEPSMPDSFDKPFLDGFWREEHNTFQMPPAELLPGVARRAHEQLESLSKYKWLVIEEWDQWKFEAETYR